MNPLDRTMLEKPKRPEGAYDFTNDWMDTLHQRMLLLFEQDLTILEESAKHLDTKAALRSKLALMQQYLKVQKLAKEVMKVRTKKPRLKRKLRAKT